MPVCSFFLRGNCQFGTKCRFDHVRPTNQGFGNSSAFGASSSFASAASPSTSTVFRSGDGSPGSQSTATGQSAAPWARESVIADLKDETKRPRWKLSSYGPSKEAPNMIDHMDVSPEELRLMYYTEMKTQRNNVKYLSAWSTAMQSMEDTMNMVVRDPQAAWDRAQRSQRGGGSFLQSPNSVFGKSAVLGGAQQRPSTFGGSAFGQVGSAFGGTGSAFGGANAFSPGKAVSAFGQPQQQSACGQQSAFGQQARPQQQQSAFGQQTGSVFGQGSPMGKPSIFGQTTSAFEQGSKQPAQKSAFGQLSPQGQSVTSAFGRQQTVFGQPSTSPAPSAFGQTAGSLQAGATSAPLSAFSGFNQGTVSAFGQAVPAFGKAQVGPSGFGQNAGLASAFGNATNRIGDSDGLPPGFYQQRSRWDIGKPTEPKATPYDYVPLEQLSVEDAELFKRPYFERGKIPEVPPPVYYCYLEHGMKEVLAGKAAFVR